MACVSDCQNETMLALALTIVSRDWLICVCVSVLTFSMAVHERADLDHRDALVVHRDLAAQLLVEQHRLPRLLLDGVYLSVRYMGAE